jgi:hypothetical protein
MGLLAVQQEPHVDETAPPPAPDWPDGPDVVLAGVAADGVDWGSAKKVAIEMLEPLGRCYAPHVEAAHGDPPQGPLRLLARVGADGGVLDADVEASQGLPGPLVECALRILRAQRFAPPHETIPTVEIDLRFVYRMLPGPAAPSGGQSG